MSIDIKTIDQKLQDNGLLLAGVYDKYMLIFSEGRFYTLYYKDIGNIDEFIVNIAISAAKPIAHGQNWKDTVRSW